MKPTKVKASDVYGHIVDVVVAGNYAPGSTKELRFSITLGEGVPRYQVLSNRVLMLETNLIPDAVDAYNNL